MVLDFSTLDDVTYTVDSSASFETVAKWMENRFVGLPIFHKSIELRVKRYHKVILKEQGELKLPKFIYALTNHGNLDDLRQLLGYVQRESGLKSFGLLYLNVKLKQGLLKSEMNRYRMLGYKIPNLVFKIGALVEVPITLAVASRKSNNYYESYAIGLNGVKNYQSALTLSLIERNRYVVNGGLHTSVYLNNIRHPLINILQNTGCRWLPREFLNRYLKNHLFPEKQMIVKELCNYVFNGCKPLATCHTAIPIQNMDSRIQVSS